VFGYSFRKHAEQFRLRQHTGASMTDFLKALNPEQRAAAGTVNGPVLIIAGAGTGKTRTLVYRLAYCVSQARIEPCNLLALTFTVKAAEEMRERAQALCGQGFDLGPVTVGTFHSLCFDLLKQHGDRIGVPNDFSIISPVEQHSLITELAGSFFNDISAPAAQRLCRQLSLEKSTPRSADQLTPFCRAYQSELARRVLLDFDDLILKTVELLQDHPAAAAAVHDRFTHVSVDEYQDVSPAQYHLLRLLCARHANLCAVGDADQAIYAFRGAQVENFLNFQIDFPDARVCYLSENYRSQARILDAAQHVIRHNKKRIEKELVPARPAGIKIHTVELEDEQAEADWIAAEIESLLGGIGFHNMRSGDEPAMGFSDIAILYRLRQQSRALSKALNRRGIPVAEHTGTWLFENRRVQILLDLLEILVNPENDAPAADLLRSGHFCPGERSAERLIAEAVRRGVELVQLCRTPESVPGLQQRACERVRILGALIEDMQDRSSGMPLYQLINWLDNAAFPGTLEPDDDLLALATAALPFSRGPATDSAAAFLKKIYLMREGETIVPLQEAVRLMTAHGAKGLEFPVVFIAGSEEDLFPCRLDEREQEDEARVEEERRLFYVAMTRACERLYITAARSRFVFGRCLQAGSSRFAAEIPDDCIRKIVVPSRKTGRKSSQQLPLFDF
jgi:DNA helicase II / ATP-dependent DNA helicase PcrA